MRTWHLLGIASCFRYAFLVVVQTLNLFTLVAMIVRNPRVRGAFMSRAVMSRKVTSSSTQANAIFHVNWDSASTFKLPLPHVM